MSDLLRNIIRLVIFIAVQVYVLNKIPHLHRFITPYLYYLFILWLPFSIPRMGLLLTGFVAGLSLDYFMQTPGLHAAACVLVAYVRPFVISVLTPKDTTGFTYREPSPRAMGWTPYLVYALVLSLLHHGYMVFLQWLEFGTILDFLVKVVATTGISLLLILTVELLFPRRLKFRTNIS
ncbi:MAG TPA: rod shape-determining protein MreD [Chitinophagaceae bacterium]|nr:rod shape-determining protein MreD [Chitinophagaceae bacterium]